MIKRKDQKQEQKQEQKQGQKQRVKTRRNMPQSLRIGHCPCSPDVGDCPRCHVQTRTVRKTRKQHT